MGHINKKYKFLMIVMKISKHIFWHAINKHGKNIIYNYENIKKGPKNIVWPIFVS
jgi:hypothetical protein